MNKEKFIICKIKIFKKYFDISQNFFDISDIIYMNSILDYNTEVLNKMKNHDGFFECIKGNVFESVEEFEKHLKDNYGSVYEYVLMNDYMPKDLQGFVKHNGVGFVSKIDNSVHVTFGKFETHLRKNDISINEYLVKYNIVPSEHLPFCNVCNKHVARIVNHIKQIHKISSFEEYEKQYGEHNKWNGKPLLLPKNVVISQSNKISGDKNPSSKNNTTEQQRKERSPKAIEFYQKKYPDLSHTEHLQMLNEAKKYISSSIKNHTTRLEYWLEKTGGDIEEAKKLLKKRQTTFSLDICVSKLGYDAGVIRHTNRQIQWNGSIKSNLKCGYSKVSNKFFNDILSHYKDEDKQYVYFNGHNGEYTVKDEITGKTYRLDFYDSKNNFVIEFQGDIYHGNPAIFAPDSYPHPFHKNQAGWTAADIWQRDAIKKDISKNALPGVKYLQLWESKYREDSSFCLERVIKLIS